MRTFRDRLAPAIRAGAVCALAACARQPAARLPAAAAPRPEAARAAVVQVGYGTQGRRSITSAVSSVDVQAVHRNTATPRMEEVLAGRVPGLEVRRVGGAYSLRIRGVSSFYGSNEPLIVVDGLPVTSGASVLSAIPPQDVQRVDVLKDAAATAIYGSRGANGVVLITTRRAR